MPPPSIKHILVIVKTDHLRAWSLALEIADWLRDRGVTSRLVEHSRGHSEQFTSLPTPKPDLIMVFGGDGTILSVARLTAGAGIPILGLNMGKVGFLASLSQETWPEDMRIILEQGPVIHSRAMLNYKLERNAETVAAGLAVNDLVVNRGRLARVVHTEFRVDGDMFGYIRSDGVIFSTATGASGYALSSGGPFLDPRLDGYLVTPICPLLNDMKPLVLPATATCQLTIMSPGIEKYLTIDGQEGWELHDQDRLQVCLVRDRLFLAGLPGQSYYANLRRKGFIGRLEGE